MKTACGYDVSVIESGLTLCQSHPFIGASSDGCVIEDREEGVIEIKCPYSIDNHNITKMQINDILDLQHSGFCLQTSDCGTNLKRSHGYYAQVQGEMAIMGLPWCDFVVWTHAKVNNIFVERIKFDSAFVAEMMPKLVSFYVEHVFPNAI